MFGVLEVKKICSIDNESRFFDRLFAFVEVLCKCGVTIHRVHIVSRRMVISFCLLSQKSDQKERHKSLHQTVARSRDSVMSSAQRMKCGEDQ
jgi:hypothetical protein